MYTFQCKHLMWHFANNSVMAVISWVNIALSSKYWVLVSGLYSKRTWAVGNCAYNSPKGSRWGQKFQDQRSRDFCPHREPSGELVAQYRPPMSFCFYLTLHLGNNLYFFKPDSSWKQQKNTVISEIDSVHSTKHVVMVTPQHLLVTS